MFGYIYYLWYGDEEIQPDERTKRIRHEMLTQIKKSKIKLKKTKLRCDTNLEPLQLVRRDGSSISEIIDVPNLPSDSDDDSPLELPKLVRQSNHRRSPDSFIKSDPIDIPKKKVPYIN